MSRNRREGARDGGTAALCLSAVFVAKASDAEQLHASAKQHPCRAAGALAERKCLRGDAFDDRSRRTGATIGYSGGQKSSSLKTPAARLEKRSGSVERKLARTGSRHGGAAAQPRSQLGRTIVGRRAGPVDDDLEVSQVVNIGSRGAAGDCRQSKENESAREG